MFFCEYFFLEKIWQIWEVTFWQELFQQEPTIEEMALDSIRWWQEPQQEPSNGFFYQVIAGTQQEPLHF